MLDFLATERRNMETLNLDQFSIDEIVNVMNQADRQIAEAVAKEHTSIVQLIEAVVRCMNNGGNLYYIGAGTSGRLGVLDAAECIPTFNTSPEMVQGLIAGGIRAMTVAVEGAEDSTVLAKEDLKAHYLKKEDFVLGIAASGRTPYVIGGLKYAQSVGATTGALSCNKEALISGYADYAIEVSTGSEILTGSTRLKAGTAQKMVLNMISTASLIHQGKVYQNLMVDVQATNEKLVERAKRIVMEATGCSLEEASDCLADSDQNPKLAIVRLLTGKNKETAKKLLAKNNGFVGKAIAESSE